jgi:hypothetical protein
VRGGGLRLPVPGLRREPELRLHGRLRVDRGLRESRGLRPGRLRLAEWRGLLCLRGLCLLGLCGLRWGRLR